MASIVLSISAAAVAAALLAGVRQTQEAVRMTRAAELAEALMDEILALPYDDPNGASALGPEAGETARSLYDNVDDYHGFSEAAGAVADATGTTYAAAYAAFDRSVTVSTSSVQPTGFAAAVAGVSVTVTVQEAGRPLAVVTRFVADPTP
ncbi:MAG: hypothetical protein ACE5E6_09220 [Phycisphaerae bacterium]